MSSSLKRTYHRNAEVEERKRFKLELLQIQYQRRNAAESDSSSDVDGENVSSGEDEHIPFREGPRDAAADPVEPYDQIAEVAAVNRDDEVGEDLGFDDAMDIDINLEVHSSDEREGAARSHSDSSDGGDGPIVFRNVEEAENFLLLNLREWAQEPGLLSKSKLVSLLHRLNAGFPKIPLSYNAFMECNYNVEITDLESGGQMWYRGIEAALRNFILAQYLEKKKKVEIDINIDGLPLAKSSKIKFWPILGYLADSTNSPFVIAIYFGTSDPPSVDEFLADYVNEVGRLHRTGFEYSGKTYAVSIRNYILDAPARALIKRCKGHGGYCACEKCTVYGITIDQRRTYFELDCPLRTDESFRLQEDPEHHHGRSPLEELGTGMVSQFRLDPMHLVFNGVAKRVFTFWVSEVGPWKLHPDLVQIISNIFIALRSSCPRDFNRKPRSLEYLSYFKTSEFRRIVLYDGLLAFKDIVLDNVFKNFLLLHCAVYIMCNPSLFKAMPGVAENLVQNFVIHCAQLYGEKFIVYNVHALIHMPSECEDHGSLDEFSAFKFENELKSIKESLRSKFKPLQQAARKELQKQPAVVTVKSAPIQRAEVALARRELIPNERVPGPQFKRLTVGRVVLQVGEKDSCFKTKNGDIVVLQNIVKRNHDVYLIGRRFLCLEDYYTYPMPSSELGIYRVSVLCERRMVYRLRQVESKCWLMPDGHHFLCVPLVHSIQFI